MFYNDFWCPPVLVCFAEAKRIPFLPPPESLDRGGQLQKSKKGDSLKTYCKSKDRWKGLSGTSSKTNRKTMNFELGEKGANVDSSKRYCKSKDRQRRPLQNLRFSKIFEKYKDTVHQKYNYCKSKDRQSRPLQNLRFSRHRRPFAKQGGDGPGALWLLNPY